MLRFFVFRKFTEYMPGNDLKKLYCGYVRSVIEYSSITYGLMLTKFQSNELENIQKRCLRCMYGFDKTYAELLQESGFETLKKRRDDAIGKFAEKTANNPVYRDWFETNDHPRRDSQRNPLKYKERLARTNRLYNSPLYHMTRTLNATTEEEEEPELPDRIDHNLNDPFAN